MELYPLIIFFIAGIVTDFIVTLNWRFVTKEKTLYAVIASFLATVISLTVFYNIFTQLDENRGWAAILSYSFGIAAGTYFGMKFQHGMKD